MVSIVIPTLNEETRLPACLAAVLQGSTESTAEVLVVDGGSSDATVDVARGYGVRVLASDPGRGRQMNRGARDANGSLLVFLPADTVVPAGWVNVLTRVDADATCRAGGFRQRFDRSTGLLRMVSRVHNMRARITGVFYGDQVPFVRRDLFEELGGYREDIDMEDVEFGTRLKRHCRPRLLGPTATTSARRFEQAGALRATAEVVWILGYWTLLRRPPRSRTFFRTVR